MNQIVVDIKLIVAVIIVVVAISGIAYVLLQQPGAGITVNDADRARFACEFLCRIALDEGLDLSEGPCLSTGSAAWEVEGWVCDVAHSPRQAVDNLEENQCPEFGVSAEHFVEFGPECGFILSV